MPADRKPFHVLEDESSSSELRDDANEMTGQPIAGVVENTMADKGKALARGAAEYAIDRATRNAGCLFDLGPGEAFDRARYYGRAREIELVDGLMHRIDLDGCGHVETGLLETEAEPASAGEKVDTDRSHGAEILSHCGLGQHQHSRC